MIHLQDIIDAYREAAANKRRSPDVVDFSVHWEARCVKLYEDIINRRVQLEAYTFVETYPRPREIWASVFEGRTLHHYLDRRIKPLIEANLTDHTFNNRKGLGQHACINAVISDIYEMSQGYTRDAWIVKLDLKGCFPNIVQDIAFAQLERLIIDGYHGDDKDELLYILRVCIFAYPTLHCEKRSSPEKMSLIPWEKSLFSKPLGIGASIGHQIWQIAVNYYFHEIDEWFLSMPEIRYERYVDDMFITITDLKWLSIIPEMRVRLAALGASLNENKFYCQHWSKGLEALGCHIKCDRVYINNRTISRALIKIRRFNRNIRPSMIDEFVSALNSTFGLLKNVNGFARAMELVDAISPKWWQYIEFDRRRVCLVVKSEYKSNYLNLVKYDKSAKKRERKRVERAAARRNVGNAPQR